jgi:Otopetrin
VCTNNYLSCTVQIHWYVTVHANERVCVRVCVSCKQANRGLFLGLFVVVLTLVAVSYYFIVDNGELSNLTFFGTEIVLLFLLCVTIVLASFEFQKLRFSASMVTGSSRLDQSLLIIATFGVFMLECFHLVSAVGNNNRAMINVLAGGTSVLAFAQVRSNL